MGRLAVIMLQEAGIEFIFYEQLDNGYTYSDFGKQ